MFSEKLNFLMNLTETSSKELGEALYFDPSYITKLRTGKAEVQTHDNFIDPAALFFANRLKTAYQIQAAQAIFSVGQTWPDDPKKIKALIAIWLREDDDRYANYIEQFMLNVSSENISSIVASHKATAGEQKLDISDDDDQNLHRSFFGKEGKRQAFLFAFQLMARQNTPTELSVYTDEDLKWFTEDKKFFSAWASGIQNLIDKGCTIRLVDSLERNTREIIDSTNLWLPFMNSGAMTLYYCTHTRDEVYHRTLMVGNGICALYSSSLGFGSDPEHAVTTVVTSPEEVAAYGHEFNDYLYLCKPLFQNFTASSADAFRLTLFHFEEQDGNVITSHQMPLSFTMPDELIQDIVDRTGNRTFLNNIALSKMHYYDLMSRGYTITELLHLPDPREVREGHIPLPLHDYSRLTGVCYTKEEYVRHMQAAMELSRTNPNYKLVVSYRLPLEITVLVKENTSGFVIRELPSEVGFSVEEPHLVTALYGMFDKTQAIHKSRGAELTEIRKFLSDVNKKR